MVLKSTYKKILEGLPSGVFVFDRKLKVVYTNAAFRRSFSDQVKPFGGLSAVLGCQEQNACGENAACGYCTFYSLMKTAVETKQEQTETMRAHVQRNGRRDTVSVRIRIMPLDENGKLFLGLTDGSFETEMEKELLSAQAVQRRLLPAGKSVGGVSYSYTYIPCLEVGGDLPDVYELNGNAYGLIADVSGKGVSAGMLSAFVKAGFDRKQPSLALALDTLNAKFNELNQDERSYITVAAVRIDEQAKKLYYAFAGHNVPILLKNAYGIHEVESPAPPISNWFSSAHYTEKELPFEKGDMLVLLTDGVTECTNSAGEQFGIERAESVLMQSVSAEDFIGKIRQALNVFCGGKYTDDVTAIAFDL